RRTTVRHRAETAGRGKRRPCAFPPHADREVRNRCSAKSRRDRSLGSRTRCPAPIRRISPVHLTLYNLLKKAARSPAGQKPLERYHTMKQAELFQPDTHGDGRHDEALGQRLAEPLQRLILRFGDVEIADRSTDAWNLDEGVRDWRFRL